MKHSRFNSALSNISEEAGKFIIEVAMPGYDKEEINISIEDKVLKISAKKDEKREGYTYREFDFAQVNRTFRLSKHVDMENISATMEHGILTISLAKVKEATPKTIAIA